VFGKLTNVEDRNNHQCFNMISVVILCKWLSKFLLVLILLRKNFTGITQHYLFQFYKNIQLWRYIYMLVIKALIHNVSTHSKCMVLDLPNKGK